MTFNYKGHCRGCSPTLLCLTCAMRTQPWARLQSKSRLLNTISLPGTIQPNKMSWKDNTGVLPLVYMAFSLFSVVCLTRQLAWIIGAVYCAQEWSPIFWAGMEMLVTGAVCGHRTDNKLCIICFETDFVHSNESLKAYHHCNCCNTGRPCNGTVVSRHD